MIQFGSKKCKAARYVISVEHQPGQNSLSSKAFLLVAFLSCLLVQDLLGQIPTITGFTPTSGTVGTTVTITGTNFNTTPANNIVIFGSTRATVSASTATQLTVTVPTGATHDYITALNASTDLLASSTKKFTPTFTPGNANLTPSHFTTGGTFTTGDYPTALAIGDLDGDGKTDLAVTNYEANTISIFRNTSTIGTISYDEKIDFAVGVNPNSLAIGDLDGDGKAEVVVANVSSHTVSVLRNTSSVGNIGFAAKLDLATVSGEWAYSVAISDLDGDGKPDIAAGTGGDKICLFRNTSTVGAISYAPKVDVVAGGKHESIAIGDLDGDGKSDLVVTNYLFASISVARNTSTVGVFSFAAAVNVTTTTFPIDVAMGDLDGDSKLDLAVTSFYTTGVSVLRNTSTAVGDISFTDIINIPTNGNTLSIAIGDMDGDGKPDIVLEETGYSDIYTL